MKRLICVLIFGSLVLGNVSLAAAAGPLFPQCPRVGGDTGCQFLINVTNFGSTIAVDPSQPSYANNGAPPPVGTGETGPLDSLIGVQNNSSVPLTSLNLSGAGSFAFDGDGICDNASGAVPSGCRDALRFHFLWSCERTVLASPSGRRAGGTRRTGRAFGDATVSERRRSEWL